MHVRNGPAGASARARHPFCSFFCRSPGPPIPKGQSRLYCALLLARPALLLEADDEDDVADVLLPRPPDADQAQAVARLAASFSVRPLPGSGSDGEHRRGWLRACPPLLPCGSVRSCSQVAGLPLPLRRESGSAF